MPFADAENDDPEEADTNDSNADHRAREEKKGQQEEDHIVDREDLARSNKDSVDRLCDVDLSQKVSAVSLADRVLGFVDPSDEHGHEYNDGDDEEQETSD